MALPGNERAFERMKAERWQQVKELLYGALECEPGKPAAFLDATCKDDHELRGEIEALLAAHEMAGSFFERRALDVAAGMVAVDPDRAMIGQTFDHYEVLSLLGAGGMGDVYLAEDTLLGRRVALKFLPDHYTQDERRLRHFQKEARAASALNHPNILTIHEIGEANGRHYIATEFIEGETLTLRMKARRMTLVEALDVAIQVTGGLAAAHAAGIVHRDIKPDNIMVRTDGIVKILDFGIAKLAEQRDDGPLDDTGKRGVEFRGPALLSTGAGSVVGTAHYMSPEQARGLDTDARADIWSLGVVLYEMVAGRAAYDGKDAGEIISRILDGEPPPPADVPGAPPGLERTLHTCLERDRESRYQSAEELLGDLKGLERELESAAVGRRPGHGPFRSRFAGLAVALAAMLAAALLLYVLLFGGSPLRSMPEIRSVAVLPLENRSGDPAQDLLADGMTEALISDLAKIGSLRVISPTSVMRYRVKPRPLPQIAKDLNVDAVVEGTVLRSGAQVRVAARLIHAPTGVQLWADSYERLLRDIPGLQKQVARAIAGEIRVKLTPEDQARLADARPVDPAAFESYLKGRSLLDKRNEAGLKAAIACLNEAVAKDGAYALPHVALSDAYFALGTVNVGAMPPAEALQRGRLAAVKALGLDPELSEAHTALGVIELYSWRWTEAEREFDRALDLNPNSAPAHSWYAIYLTTQGRIGEAIAHIYRARDIDPLSPHIRQNVGWILHYTHRYDEEIEQYKRALELDPNFLFARLRLAGVYLDKGMFGAAVSEFERAIGISDRGPATLSGLGYLYAVAGRKDQARRILTELMAMRAYRYVNPSSIAQVHLGLGEKEKALDWLERAYQERSFQNLFLNVDEEFDPIRSNPRFQDLLRRVGLPSSR